MKTNVLQNPKSQRTALRLRSTMTLRLVCYSLAFNLLFGGWAKGDSEMLSDGVEKFIVPTQSKEDPKIPFYVRIPKGYREKPGRYPHRVFLTCPFINEDGLVNLQLNPGLAAVADERNWFILSPTFKFDPKNAQDRNRCFYYPETYSGKAVLDALVLIQKKYPISVKGLLLHGLSGGGQFVHRFAIWAPDRVAAVAVDSSSWFDNPNEKARGIGWLITIGEDDHSFANTLEFTAKLREVGVLPILRTYAGMTHIRGNHIPNLALNFLTFYDDQSREKLRAGFSLNTQGFELPVAASQMKFVGDAQSWNYFPNTAETAENIAGEEIVYLPTETIAKSWAVPDGSE